MNPREAAYCALMQVEEKGAWLDQAVNNQLAQQLLGDADRRLAYRLAYGVTTYRLALDYVLDKLCRQGIASLPPAIKTILRLGVYQIIHMDRIPDYAAVNEAVDQARRQGGPSLAGLVNGVLRNVVRRRDNLLTDLPQQPEERIAVEFSHPRWLVKRWLQRWGEDFTRQLCAANNRPGPITLRVNTANTTVEQYTGLLAEAGIEAAPSSWCRDMLVLKEDVPFSRLPGYGDGLFIVQGEASALPVANLDLQPGIDVLDMCSAPGGKATHIAAKIAPGTVTALDIHAHRLELVRENFQRLGLDNYTLAVVDARQADRAVGRTFTRILLDAPCTGTGIVRNKPDIKWRRRPGDVAALAALQRQLLDKACDLLSPGGIAVYSTCTLLAEENEAVVEAALTTRRDIRLVPLGGEGGGHLTTFPHVHNLDGFFVAKVQKVV